MKDIILDSRLPHIKPPKKQTEYYIRPSTTTHFDGRLSKPLRNIKQPTAISSQIRAHTEHINVSWGRSGCGGSLPTTIGCALIVFLCPLLVILLWNALEDFDGSLFATLSAFWSEGPLAFIARFAAKFSLKDCIGYAMWLSFQSMLYTYLPCKMSVGQLTPAGHLLKYKTNGFFAWAITHTLGLIAAMAGILDPAILAKHWGGLLIAANIYGFLISGFAYMKAQLAPTHPEDRKYSGQKFLFRPHKINL